MKKYLFFLFGLFYFINCFAQNQYKVWYFGEHAGLDFNTSPPTATNNSAMVQQEGCANICDNNGQLLFYTNGQDMWNRNDQLMPNGSGLLGDQSATQSALIVPLPGNNNIYYVFTVTSSQIAFTQLCYSIVDMTLNAGLGDVTATKNVMLHTPVLEKLTATLNSNGTDYWIVVKEMGANAFLSYSLTSTGIDPNPVVSHTGLSTNNPEDVGYAKISPDGSKLCIAYYRSLICQLFDFNNSTGQLANPIDFVTIPVTIDGPYGIEFSPDNSKLYIMQNHEFVLWQYDLLAGSPAAIQNSGVEIIHLGGTETGLAIVAGPDKKLYISHYMHQYLSVINQPNLAGTACGYAFAAVPLAPNTRCRVGLPNNINYPANSCPTSLNISNNVTICSNQSYQLPWGTIVSTSGIYRDTVRNQAGSCDSIISTVNLSVFPVSNVNTAVQICSGQTHQLPSGIIVNTAGIYIDTVRSVGSCDSIITTTNLSVFPVSNVNTNVQICSGQTYQLPSGTIVSAAAIYTDTLRSTTGCDSIISLTTLSVFPVGFLNTEIHICSNETYHLPSGTIVNTPGIYIDTLRSVGSCDSVINTIHFFINNVSATNLVDSIYVGQTYTLPSGETVSAAGVYQSVLQNSAGCDSVVAITLKLKKQISDCITLKNAITPNGDGINDYWILYRYNCFKRLEVSVYNRYGSLVYHSDDYKNDWNGKYKNKELPDGTYYYVVKVISFDGKEHVFRDNVTILR